MQELKKAISSVVKDLFDVELEPELTRPDEKFGDYSTNVAMQLAGQLQQNPREIADKLVQAFAGINILARVEVAGPGFINFTLTDAVLAKSASRASDLPRINEGKEVLVEFGDPNPFKEMHIGHLYSYIVGDSICRLLESTGATVRRLSYHGDIGLHVAKAIWGIMNLPEGQQLGSYYAAGAQAYGDDKIANQQIQDINEHIYKKDDEQINHLYEQGKKASFEQFDQTLSQLGVKTDKRYLESESAKLGVEFIRQNSPTVFKESAGAIIYEGEKAGLHTRVFITSRGLPTYEAKDLGLAELKKQDYPNAARSIIITANEQTEYFKVMLAALAEFDKALADKTTHIAHGFLSLSTGKMSSRTGEVYSALSLLTDVQHIASQAYPDSTSDMHLAAVKYGFLKHRLGSDITYDIEESVSLDGNSGPYLQYAHARACSILAKAINVHEPQHIDFDEAERSLARKISLYPEVINKATEELMPHHVANYLYELAQNFNRFYEKSRILGHERQDLRLQLAKNYQIVLKHGLELLNIEPIEKV